jgi:hypothetical protein
MRASAMSPTIVADLIIFFPRAAGVCVCAWKSEHLTTTGQISKKTLCPLMENNKKQPETLFDMGNFLIFLVLHPQL